MARGWWPVVAVLVVVAGARAAGPAAKPAAPPPNQAAIKVVETEAAAKAAIEKARTSGTGLVADLALGHEGQLVRAESAESLPQGRYRLHALVARSPHDHILAEAVVGALRADACRTPFVVLPKRTAAPAKRPKKVFAHYMGCYPPVRLFSMDGLPATPFQHPAVEFRSGS